MEIKINISVRSFINRFTKKHKCEKCGEPTLYSKRCSTSNTDFWYCKPCTIKRWAGYGGMIKPYGTHQTEEEREEELRRFYS